MLKTRVITAGILLTLAILGILWLPLTSFIIISGMVFLLALWEWTALAGFISNLGRLGCLLTIPLLSLLILAVFQWLGKEVLQEGIPHLILGFWILATFFLVRYPKHLTLWKSKITGVIAGCMVLAPTWGMLISLQYLGAQWVLYVLSLIWAADTAAYFVGKRFGKHKLAPTISPGKTWEGVFGALIAAFFVAIISYRLLEPRLSFLGWVILAWITVIFSIVGDLFESAFKRARNLKDSGWLLPGHGGILDRIDGLTAGIPIFTLNFMFFS